MGNDDHGHFAPVKAIRSKDDDSKLKEVNKWIKKKFLSYTEVFMELGDGTDDKYDYGTDDK